MTLISIEDDGTDINLVCGSNRGIGEYDEYELKITFDDDDKVFNTFGFHLNDTHMVYLDFPMTEDESL